MKKVLFASTALVAAGLMTAGTASASEKIKLELGGYSKWWIVGAWQDSSFEKMGGGTGVDYANVDIKGDNEIFFGGSTKLDNGMTVGVMVELEAGGDAVGNDRIDKSYAFAETAFGKVIVGSEANGTALLHVMAPDAAGNTDSDGVLTGGWGIARPTAVSRMVSTSIDTDGEAEKITYVAPTFAGLTLGGSYIPNAASEDDRGPVRGVEAYGVGALYANTFGAVDVKVSGGWVTYDLGNAYGSSNEYSTGAQVSFKGFTVGGSYRNRGDNLAGGNYASTPNAVTVVTENSKGTAWDAGIQYATGPWAVSFVYFTSEVEGAISTRDDDQFTVYQVSAKYSMGPGVDLLATVGHAEYDDESRKATTGGDANHNEGWAVMTGLGLAF